MKIYTKTGDKGTTRLVDGSCVEKFNPRVEAYGCTDELNSQIGLVRSHIHLSKIHKLQNLDPLLQKIQEKIFCIGSLLATSSLSMFNQLPQITDLDITHLEQAIDLHNATLPDLKNFILPTGHIVASHLHICRTACRRAERRSSEIYQAEQHYQNVLIYLNRLSDLFFVLARWTNAATDTTDTIWKT